MLVTILLGGLLAGCAARPPEGPPPAKPTWQAAIGRVEVEGAYHDCTGVLIRSDVVLTAAHCLHPKGALVAAHQIGFVSSMPGADKAPGIAILARGADVPQGHIKRDLIPFDWATIRIAPVNGIPPIPIVPMSLDQARAEIARGAAFFSAGYGQGAKTRLMAHQRCSLLPAESAEVAGIYFTSSCVVRLGDSGGPVILVEGNRPKLIGLIVGFDPRPDIEAPIGFIAPATAFAPYVGAPLVSFLGY